MGKYNYLGESLIGSLLPGRNSKSPSVVEAFWARSGDDLEAIDYNWPRVGVVQFFASHTTVFKEESGSSDKSIQHMFAYVLWKKLHPHSDFLGISSTIGVDLFETPDPVQRISNLAAFSTMPIEIGNITEAVFVSSPLPIQDFF